MRYSDQPINLPSQDLLGRATFANTLARAIDQFDARTDGFVIGLTGEWGSGKSSIVKLICYYLRQFAIERISKAKIFPEDSGEALSPDELDRLAILLSQVQSIIDEYKTRGHDLTRADACFVKRKFRNVLGTDEQANSVYRYWRLLSRVDDDPNIILLHFAPWMISGRAELASSLLRETARAIGDRLGSGVERAFNAYLEGLMKLVPLVGTGIDLGFGTRLNPLVSTAARWLSGTGAAPPNGPTLECLKANLDSQLRALTRQKVLIIIDDLDRLAPSEAYEMASLVKSLGNLPNVIYLMSYHESKLADLVCGAVSVNGNEFLEKIIQYKRSLPLFSDEDREGLFEHYFSDLIKELEPNDAKRLSHAWAYVLTNYLTTPRSICRLANTYFLARAALAEYTDPVDLLVLEALSLFEPQTYDLLRSDLTNLGDMYGI